MFADPLPARVRVLVLGGGIHGVGILHDLASRGWRDIHLVEKSRCGSGTSSRSTKLIHGGLRYLRNIRDFWLVSESLRERKVLLRLAGDIVKPLELLLPALKRAGMPRFMLRTGLGLYDLLAGKAGIAKHRHLSIAEARAKVPTLDMDIITSVFSFWDAQTDDLALVRRVAASARKLGAGISEGWTARSFQRTEDGWLVHLVSAAGEVRLVSALYVVNALGPWANSFLEQNGLTPVYTGFNNEGIHLLFPDMGHKAGTLLQSPEDDRIFFVLPWFGKTLVGTTESVFAGDPDKLHIQEESVRYLLGRANRFFKGAFREQDIQATFSGLRWLACDDKRDISRTSRGYEIGEHANQRGLMLTLYGGKLTTYRKLSETIGNRILSHFGEQRPSRTHEAEMWAKAEDVPNEPTFAIPGRFQTGGIAFNPRDR